jgi:hypothetical protein
VDARTRRRVSTKASQTRGIDAHQRASADHASGARATAVLVGRTLERERESAHGARRGSASDLAEPLEAGVACILPPLLQQTLRRRVHLIHRRHRVTE